MSSVTRPPSCGSSTPPRARGRSKAPLTRARPGSRRSGPMRPCRWRGSGSAVSPSRKQTISASVTASERHMASPLPSAGPASASTSSCWTTRAPAAPATSAVPSLEAASMTTISSMSPACAAGPTVCSSTPAIVAAHSLVGITTAIEVSPLSVFRRSRWKVGRVVAAALGPRSRPRGRPTARAGPAPTAAPTCGPRRPRHAGSERRARPGESRRRHPRGRRAGSRPPTDW